MGLQVFAVLLLAREELAAALAVELGLEFVVESVALQGLAVLQELATLLADYLAVLNQKGITVYKFQLFI